MHGLKWPINCTRTRTVHSGSDGGCVAVVFSDSITSSAVASARRVPYRHTRKRLHTLKQRFDDLVPRPGPTLMPLVAVSQQYDAWAE